MGSNPSVYKILIFSKQDFSLRLPSEFQNGQTGSVLWFCRLWSLIGKNSAAQKVHSFCVGIKGKANEIHVSSSYPHECLRHQAWASPSLSCLADRASLIFRCGPGATSLAPSGFRTTCSMVDLSSSPCTLGASIRPPSSFLLQGEEDNYRLILGPHILVDEADLSSKACSCVSVLPIHLVSFI